MNIGIIGLGKMGTAVAYLLMNAGYQVIGFDPNENAQKKATNTGVHVVSTLAEMADQVRIFWLFVPAGKIVDDTIDQLLPHLQKGDIIIDGGNSKFTNSMRRAQTLSQKGMFFLDCGTSGGVWGKEKGFCLMVGGDKKAYEKVLPFFEAVAAPNGVARVGNSGTGHYVKMVHNGIEYALLQAYAEGFHLLKSGSFKDENLNLEQIARLWDSSSVIRSWLLELALGIFEKDQNFDAIAGEVAQGGTGKWTAEDAKKHNVPVPTLDASLQVRDWSQKTGGNYATKLIALLRNAFGGHEVKKTK